MSAIEVSPQVAARLAAEAIRRGVTVDVLVSLLADQLGDDPIEHSTSQKPTFIGIGSSTSNRGGREADDLLAEGFGRS